ncbi:MAG TPA: pitrilysin family protein [Lacunisphaera sp.]|jgi:zinc protease|nr:pitrilysin family protein [Lacunisphaera sp.]
MKRILAPFALLVSAALPALSPSSGLRAAPVTVDGFTYVKSLGGIDEYKLEANGLSVLLMPDRTAPVVTFMVTYHVGSRNEVTGSTGSTHLLEHLMFKGGPNYNDAKGNSVKQFLERIGGNYNATTWLDRTNYYAEVGNDQLEGYLAIEADRMRNLWIRESDRQTEMTVVRNEFEQGENDPQQALDKEIFAAAFQAHPYHHSTIGWRSDIEKVPIEKLRAFYDTYYWPNNATATIIGDFDPAAALGLVKKYYGAYSKAPHPIPPMYTEEPEQTGPRRVMVQRSGEVGVVGISYKSPAGSDPDWPALNVLATVLASGKTSRFYRGLTDRNLTTTVSASADFYHDPSLFQVYAEIAPGVAHEPVEQALLAEIARVRTEGVTDAEVATAIGQLDASVAYARDGSFAIASVINEDIAAGDWTLYITVPEAIRKVTAADVKRVAGLYLDENKSTTGWFVPVKAAPAK